MKHGKENGAALISVLLIFTLITILASQLITRSQADIERTYWLTTEAQAYQYALGGEMLARQVLYSKYQALRSEGLAISPVPELLPPYQPDHGEIAVEIIDLQGLINLNNIKGNTEQRKLLINLFQNLLLKPELLPLLADWVDSDSTPQAGGGEDFSYLSFEPALRTANRPISDPSELMVLPNIELEEYEAISGFLSALNQPTALNLNTAPAEVLSLIDTQLSGEQVANHRELSPNGFISVEEFLLSDMAAGLNLAPSALTVTSGYYGVKIRASINERIVWLYVRLSFDNETGQITLIDRTPTQSLSLNTLSLEAMETTDSDQDGGSI
ncbi:MAG TPA: general secretion pathway protein GspK [Porticoccus sp.]|nr:general secretion pathway protein GspK [Porticoccus sp.]